MKDPESCGKRLKVFYGEKQVDVAIIDRCDTCSRHGLELGRAAYYALVGGDEDKGPIHVHWHYI